MTDPRLFVFDTFGVVFFGRGLELKIDSDLLRFHSKNENPNAESVQCEKPGAKLRVGCNYIQPRSCISINAQIKIEGLWKNSLTDIS
jgi:hypothetical protein